MKNHVLFVSFILSALLITSCAPKFKPAEYTTIIGTASAGKETQISLGDGASISIPEESINSDVSVKIERNPDKAKSLPPLPDGFVQVSDFYNFQITSGELQGPVDITLPINEKMIPNGNGLLMEVIPTQNGWEARPVENNGDKTTIFTSNIGDPLIAWHFIKSPEEKVCGSTIALSVIQDGDKFDVLGGIVPGKQSFLLPPEKDMSNINVDIQLGIQERFGIKARHFQVTTTKDGTFSLTLDPQEIPEIIEGWNDVFATAECDPMRNRAIREYVEGYAEFQYYSKTQSSASAAEAPIESPVASQPIATPQSPTDKITVPNVVGMTFEDAQKTFEDLGFNTTWVDGKSSLALGKIYSQAPVAGTLSIPHRTTVVLYRTIEVVTIPPECAQFNLTPEECTNMGQHLYRTTCTLTETGTRNCGCDNSYSGGEINISFSGGNTLLYGEDNSFTKTNINTYVSQSTESCNNITCQDTSTLTFNENGYKYELIDVAGSYGSCTWVFDYTIVK